MIHLHTRSCYSLLKSPFRIRDIVSKAKENGQKKAILTDLNVFHGLPAFIQECRKEGIDPVLGMEVKIDIEGLPQSFLLIARNNKGLKKLFRLSSRINLSKEPLKLKDLTACSEDCVIIPFGSFEDEYLSILARQNHQHDLQMFLDECRHLFPHFYLGISRNDIPDVREVNSLLEQVAHSMEIEPVMIHVIYYPEAEDAYSLQILEAIDQGEVLSKSQIPLKKGRSFVSQEFISDLYSRQEIENTERIVEDVSYDFSEFQNHLPDFNHLDQTQAAEYLKKLCERGLEQRFKKIPDKSRYPEYRERLDYELSVINSMGFANYFLIVMDLIREARKRRILVGPGRGSAAGSLVSYCLYISHIDPVENTLLFERFLNPERISMPDIDMDFPDDHRDEMILYLEEKYGKGHVSHIAAFSTMKAKSVLRDCARVLGIPLKEVDELCRQIKVSSLKEAYETNPEFALKVQKNDRNRNLYEQALKLEGLPRHMTTHAGGIVLSREPIDEVAPLAISESEVPSEQYSMEYLEKLGLIKFDLLSIRNLSLLENIRKSVSDRVGRNLDLLKLPMNDPKTFRLLQSGYTLAIFQLESDGIRDLEKRFKPRVFSDLAAILALYRPGPMKNIGLYLDARQSRKPNSIHPLLEELLKESYGIFLYQEQIMKAAQILGDFSLAQADSLRKAMSKKNRQLMESYKEQFLNGAARKGLKKEEAERIFSIMEKFTEYGFNKSHSYAYGLICYQMAFLKANFPLEFYKESLNRSVSSPSKLNELIAEFRQVGRVLRNEPFRILPLDIRYSGAEFEIEGDSLRAPLSLVRSMGKNINEKIVEARKEKPFRTLNETLARLLQIGMEENQIEDLIKAGAFNGFGVSASELLEKQDSWIGFKTLYAPGIEGLDFFDRNRKDSEIQHSQWQKEVFGFYLDGHPVKGIRFQWNRRRRDKRQMIPNFKSIQSKKGKIEVIGQISGIKKITAKNKKEMSFTTLEDESGRIDMVLFPELHKLFQDDLKPGSIIHASGTKDRENSFKADHFEIIEN